MSDTSDPQQEQFAELFGALAARAAREKASGDVRLAGALALIKEELGLTTSAPETWTAEQRSRFLVRLVSLAPDAVGAGATPQSNAGTLSQSDAKPLRWPSGRWGKLAYMTLGIIALCVGGLLVSLGVIAAFFTWNEDLLLGTALSLIGMAVVTAALFFWRRLSLTDAIRYCGALAICAAVVFGYKLHLEEQGRIVDQMKERTNLIREKLDDGRAHGAIWCGPNWCSNGWDKDKAKALKTALADCERWLGKGKCYSSHTTVLYGKCISRAKSCNLFSCNHYYEVGDDKLHASTRAYQKCLLEGGKSCEADGGFGCADGT